MPAKNPHSFRALRGTHSTTLKEHLRTSFTLNRAKRKNKREYNRKRLEEEARRIILIQLRLPDEIEVKMQRISKQRENIDRAAQQLKSEGGIRKRLAQKLLKQAMENLEELYTLQKARRVPVGEIIVNLQSIYHILAYKERQTYTNARKLEPDFGENMLRLITGVHENAQLEILGKKFKRYKDAVESSYTYIESLLKSGN